MDRQVIRTFAAVLAALVVFGLLVLGYKQVSGPSKDECLVQQFTDAISKDNGGRGSPIDPECD
jgi:hypothetical protein